eukprot:TRINITY_DN2194_c0_g2_i1.p1 TRINITY_DN2194_c0_g2~~TRINITY_DN2194_c0_g2_i1.p1  ORF type:complete len:356 (-),score=139.71 TRINITY_DN2194_c0_g2_i1:129-1196(-)
MATNKLLCLFSILLFLFCLNQINCQSFQALGGSFQNFKSAYDFYKNTYITSYGAPVGLRVRRPSNNDDTVSEGIAYGMLASVFANDQATFNGLWTYGRSYFNSDGCMAWHISSSGGILDPNCATDAELDMAYSLIVADKRWGGYRDAAVNLINTIYNSEVEPGTNILKPGNVWGGSDCSNPSYYAPGYYKVFNEYTSTNRWSSVYDAGFNIISKVNQYNAGTGLVPDWCTAQGTQACGNWHYSWDACRTPWRLSVDAYWYQSSKSLSQCGSLNNYWRSVGVNNIGEATLDGKSYWNTGISAFYATAACCACFSTDYNYRNDHWQKISTTYPSYDYYRDSLHMLSLLFVTGSMNKY